MAVETGTATDYLNLMDLLRQFLIRLRFVRNLSFSGTGPGTFSAGPEAKDNATIETWTLEVTDATTSGSETWSVTGSVTGAAASATTGVAYDNGNITFTISGSGYAVGDTFTFDADSGWVQDEWNGTDEMILHAKGAGGNETVYVGWRGFQDTGADYYNWELRGYIGYNSGEAFDAHPGTSPDAYVHLWNSSIPYWFVANSSRVVMIAKISTTYQSMYMGKFLPYATPNQYPYPLIVAGTSDTSTWRWSEQHWNHRAFWTPGRYGFKYVYPDNSWQTLYNYYDSSDNETSNDASNVVPKGLSSWRSENPDGSRVLLQAWMYTNAPSNAVLGELEGVFIVTGYGLSSEDTITINGVSYLVAQNIHRNRVQDYAAIKLE